MDIYKLRINEVENHFLQNDLSLGFRRLIDLILDLGDISYYRKILAYADLFYEESNQDNFRKEQALQIIGELKLLPSPIFQEEVVLLKTNQVEKSYARRNFKLHPITFDLKSREVVGLVGENGNGKTTLLRIIGGELKPTAGSIDYNFSKADLFSFELKSQLVYVPQRIEELYGNLMNNLQFTLSSYNIKGEENFLLAQVMLARLGLWQYRNLEWSQLSSGYKMRFELARTLLRRPKVLLLDEPLANLDIMAQQIILEDLKFLSQSVRNPFGVILSSQQLYEVEKVSTEVIFLEQGKLKNQTNEVESDVNFTIIEIDVTNSKEELLTVLNPLNLKEIKFNGGSYIAYFDSGVSIKNVLTQLGNSDLDVKYVRDISASSRRFFVN
ncbi:ABC transporter ATP-binding protein [Faecalibacter macacae]|uniref:ABC transporter ATP-binding protein n=1 Tax=Faecalibacter macacae TaxID=1859289 RepID=A0A3L9M6I7_9FLAO|nr:ABC transporter ATP-binding protein [Faecalibacter macacae]RLZ06884.1 ABC transporter ATP-binding protein [Faecalibacter macacae]